MPKELTPEQIALLAKIPLKILLNEIKMRAEIKGKTPLEIAEMIEQQLPGDRAHAEEMIEYRNPEDADAPENS